MHKKKSIKRWLSGVLVTCMVSTILSPALPALASTDRLNPGDPTSITFDTTTGPNLIYTNYDQVTGAENDILVVGGQAGSPLTDSILSIVDTEERNSRARPVLPAFKDEVVWEGYTFRGWQDQSARTMLDYLPYAFSYDREPVTYKAIWSGNNESRFDFTVMHYRDLEPERNGSDGPEAWVTEGADQILEFFNKGDWTTPTSVNAAIADTYKRNIPGYKLESVLIKNNWSRNFGETSGQGTMEELAKIDAQFYGVKGYMPNDDLTVAYRYAPDEDKKFSLTIQYVDENGTPLKNAETQAYSAESPIYIEPAEITAYNFSQAQIIAGLTDDLENQGVYSISTIGYGLSDEGAFSGWMPNQAVAIVYTYELDQDYQAQIVVNRVDENGLVLEEPEILALTPGAPYSISVENKEGYKYGQNEGPNITWQADITDWLFNEAEETFSFTSGAIGGSINITYVPDTSDPTMWARIDFLHNGHGSLANGGLSKSKMLGSYTIEELTADLNPQPDSHYLFDGWYKANTLGTGIDGDKLTGTIEITGDIKLFANFIEDSNEWVDLIFVAGMGGSISGSATPRVEKGITWGELEAAGIIPAVQPDTSNGYTFLGWYNGVGQEVHPDLIISTGETYTARFVLYQTDNSLSIPDAVGAVVSDGSGQITIQGINVNRQYAVTDMDGVVLAVMTNFHSQNQAFTAMVPGSYYYVYELAIDAAPVVGELLADNVDVLHRSQPARVGIPAIDNNYGVTDDAEAGLKRITILPASGNASYAVLDESWNPVNQEHGVWVNPSAGNPKTAILSGLEPGNNYIVVAKPIDSDDNPTDKVWLGKVIQIPSESEEDGEDEESYTITILNGGYVAGVERNELELDIPANAVQVVVRAGDKVKIDAPSTGFQSWESLIGSLTLSYPNRRNQTITMPAGDVVLRTVYNTSAGWIAGASVDYSPKNGRFALNMEDDILENLLNELVDNPADDDALASGSEVDYTIRFDQRSTATADEKEAISDVIGDLNGTKIAWALDISLYRKVNGTNKALVDGGNHTPEIQVYAGLEDKHLSNLDYQLWKVEEDNGSYSASLLTMTPDGNDVNDSFTGSFLFEGNVGDTIILTYTSAYQVNFIDNQRGKRERLTVRAGDSLEDTNGFFDFDFHNGYLDTITGIQYEFVGLSKRKNTISLYDPTTPVTKKLNLYVVYEPEDDELWQQAKRKLEEMIDKADALKNHSSTSEANKEILNDAISDALLVRDQVPRPLIEDLEDAYEILKAIVDSIASENSGGGNNGGGNNGGGNNGGGNNGGGNSGGGNNGGGNNGGTTTAANNSSSAVNIATIPGKWQNIDPQNHKWIFIRTDGSRLANQWAYLSYTFNGVTRTDYYYFKEDGTMASGWLKDHDGNQYFLSTLNDGWFGHMVTGWREINGSWYYFNTLSANTQVPFGAMYIDGVTPDGFRVDTNGIWRE